MTDEADNSTLDPLRIEVSYDEKEVDKEKNICIKTELEDYCSEKITSSSPSNGHSITNIKVVPVEFETSVKDELDIGPTVLQPRYSSDSPLCATEAAVGHSRSEQPDSESNIHWRKPAKPGWERMREYRKRKREAAALNVVQSLPTVIEGEKYSDDSVESYIERLIKAEFRRERMREYRRRRKEAAKQQTNVAPSVELDRRKLAKSSAERSREYRRRKREAAVSCIAGNPSLKAEQEEEEEPSGNDLNFRKKPTSTVEEMREFLQRKKEINATEIFCGGDVDVECSRNQQTHDAPSGELQCRKPAKSSTERSREYRKRKREASNFEERPSTKTFQSHHAVLPAEEVRNENENVLLQSNHEIEDRIANMLNPLDSSCVLVTEKLVDRECPDVAIIEEKYPEINMVYINEPSTGSHYADIECGQVNNGKVESSSEEINEYSVHKGIINASDIPKLNSKNHSSGFDEGTSPTPIPPFTDSDMIVSSLSADGKRRLICKLCDTEFRFMSRIIKHLRSHSDEKPFSCEVCGARFKLIHHLMQHERTHTGERPFRCELCDAKFRQLAHLIVHKRTHTGEKPYRCGSCGAQFRQSGSLAYHEQKHTAAERRKERHNCEICSGRFEDSQALSLHRRTMHDKDGGLECGVYSVKFRRSRPLVAGLQRKPMKVYRVVEF